MNNRIKPIAFYLPQYHAIPENNEWWGQGFTEWTNVKKATPNFDGHYQPHIPSGGYYDLRDPHTMENQAKLAKKYGVYGFCFYWYWFDGKRLLEKPLYDLLNNNNVDTNFCFCWANENWTRTWDGRQKDILMAQNYDSNKLQTDFLESMIPFFKDERYIKVDGKPMLLIYRSDIIPNLSELTKQWRAQAKNHGFPDLHLVSVYSFENDSYEKIQFDAGVEFPPHGFFSGTDSINSSLNITNPSFKGMVIDYKTLISRSIKKSWPAKSKVYRGLLPSWDNTARRQNNPHIIHNSTSELFHLWLNHSIKSSAESGNEFIFVNAWNEWGEGCHLEPDYKDNLSYLEAIQNALNENPAPPQALIDFNKFNKENWMKNIVARARTILKKMPPLLWAARQLYKLTKKA